MVVGVGAEGLLMIVTTGLYLVDSSLFLEPNEAALIRCARGQWFAGFGLDRWRLGGKEPYLPNPFTPFRPLFRLKWRFESPAPEGVAPGRGQVTIPLVPTLADLVAPTKLKPFEIHATMSALLLFVVLPIALFAPIHIAFAIGVVAALYANILWAVLRLARVRETFKLDRRSVAALVFECLACPPFSVNLVRKLCARLAVTEDLLAAGARLMSPDAYACMRAQCLRRIDEQIDGEGEDTPRMHALLASRPSHLAGLGPQGDDSGEQEAGRS